MPQFVVLLRGVNVGKANRIPMASFRQLLDSAGFSEVRTLLNSGNAVFRGPGRSPAGHAETIGARLAETAGLRVLVVVKSAAEFLAAVAERPRWLAGDGSSRVLVAFAQSPDALRGLSALQAMVEPPEQFQLGDHAAYLDCANGILESKAGSAVLGKLGRDVTTRNWATVLKLKALLAGAAA